MRFLLALFLVAACSPGAPSTSQEGDASRVISLDYCADLYALGLLPKERILALSPDAEGDFQYLQEEARGIRTIRAEAEEILLARPDLVIRSYGGDTQLLGFLERAGIPVVNIGYAGSFDAIADTVLRVGSELNAEPRAEQLASALQTPPAPRKGKALYLTPSGATSGPGTLMDELLSRGGFENFEQRPGWRTLPLENLAYQTPDHIVTGFFDSEADFAGWWGPMRHTLAAGLLEDTPRTDLSGALLSCGAWPLAEAAKQLRAAP
ncbi:ABC transporter substrate-binding protein [Parvularcula sp. ZS-1/3]|uniref:ABC transporter substrate-binding protein n=1 Tax=Parvularcula mediterranea TaxID=2732508 RepID=A0A7Y3W3Z6_9PROT|nr:ABC transporter substrate-binding protein [Parvularcula mediterranea]NNU14737.1 ABC transporter substrate-binding protein [Parvularcula mediterranea]